MLTKSCNASESTYRRVRVDTFGRMRAMSRNYENNETTKLFRVRGRIFFVQRLDGAHERADIKCATYRRGLRQLDSTGGIDMRKILSAIALLSIAFVVGGTQIASAQTPFYKQTNLISDDTSLIPAAHQDSHTVNAWGLTASPTSPWWIANNGDDTSTLYNAFTDSIPSLVVAIPGGAPTGAVWNSANITGPPPVNVFIVRNGSASGSAAFIFSSEAGIISGWNPNVPAPGSTQATVAATVPNAVYKGLAIAGTGTSARLYATNFHAGTVDVFDSTFTLLPNFGFVDPNLPAGYAPFGIQNIGGTLYVTYALQDEAAHDDVPGVGHGYIDAYDTAGHLLRRVASKGPLNSPWGLAFSPDDFALFSDALLVGNFGDGLIHAYDVAGTTGDAPLLGQFHSEKGPPLKIDGLWALQFGHGAPAGSSTAGSGSSNTLYFTSGPFGESHGLFGSLVPAGPPGHNSDHK